MESTVTSPFPFEALPRVWSWMRPFREKVSDDFSPQTLPEFLEAMAAKWESVRSWAVYGDAELGGLITFEQLTPWVGTAHFLLKQQFHARGIAVKAARAAAAEIFERETIGKLVFYPLAGNLAIGSLLCNIGARREGRLEAHTVCGGKPTDMCVYGLTKREFNEHASRSDSSGDRGDRLDCGVRPEREAEDDHNDGERDLKQHVEREFHELDHADVLASAPEPHGPVGGLLPKFDEQSHRHARTDPQRGVEQHQPGV